MGLIFKTSFMQKLGIVEVFLASNSIFTTCVMYNGLEWAVVWKMNGKDVKNVKQNSI